MFREAMPLQTFPAAISGGTAMSAQFFHDDILFLQRFLSCCGFYGGDLDGLYGPKTSAAEAAFDQTSATIAAQAGSFDARSETNIRSLQIKAQPLARQSLGKLIQAGHDARIISGTRSYAQQNALYRQGRSNGRPVVTNARGGQSWHNFGLAWDIGLFDEGAYITDGGPYEQVSSIAKVAGLEWGGDWPSFRDMPHYQVATEGRSVSAARIGFEKGCRA